MQDSGGAMATAVALLRILKGTTLMPKNTIASAEADELVASFSNLLSKVPGTMFVITNPAQDYTIIRITPGDGSDYEEVIVDNRGVADGNFTVTHRTVPKG